MTLREHLAQVLTYSSNAICTFDVYLDEFRDEIEVARVEPDRVFAVILPSVVSVDEEGYGHTESPRRKVHHQPFHAIFAWADEVGVDVGTIDLDRRLITLTRRSP